MSQNLASAAVVIGALRVNCIDVFRSWKIMLFFPHGLALKCRTDWHRSMPQCRCQQSALEGLLAVRDHAKMSDFVDSDHGPRTDL